MEAKARTRFVRISPRKLRLVCDLIKGKRLEEAVSILEFTPKRGAKILAKTLLSAVELEWRQVEHGNACGSRWPTDPVAGQRETIDTVSIPAIR